MSGFTLIHPGGEAAVEAVVSGDDLRVDPEGLADALGWHLRDEGLCRGDVCVPVRDRDALVDERGIDLAVFAELLDLPLAVEPACGVAALGTPHAERDALLAGAEAPDFTLPDVAGKLHSLSDFRGKKVLLVAYASW